LLRVAQTPIDAFEFSGRWLVDDVLYTGFDIECDLGKLVLRLWRPGFDAHKDFGQELGFHKAPIPDD
jgi:hypothetical protein